MSTLLETHGVHLIGDFSGRTSLCQSGRDLIAAIERIGCPVQVLDIPLSPGRMPLSGRLKSTDYQYEKPRSPLSIIHWNGDSYEGLARDLPSELFENRRIIGVWYWETEQQLPESHRRGYDLVDEVWVTTQFVADSLSPNSPVPLYKYPHLITPLNVPESWELPPGVDNDRFVYLFSFDYRSISKRKNPEGVCEAFVRAFPQPTPNGPLCVVKSVAGQTDHPLEYLELRSRYSERPDILFIDGWIPPEQRDSLMARANCYVSLHRSEGLGLTMMECMSIAKPCISTHYSGNLEFMTPDNSWLVPYKPTPIGTGAWPYPPDHTWAEPDLDAAAAAFRDVYDHPAQAHEKALKGQQVILDNYSLDAVSTRVRQLLQASIDIPPRPKPLVQNPSPNASAADKTHVTSRSRAYQLIKESKELDKRAREQRRKLSRRNLSSEANDLVKTLQDIIRIQQQIQTETLRELGEIKQRLKNYHGATLDGLVRDQQLTTKLLTQLVSKIQ